uniref:GPN-loop GTPase 3 n=1 Tax=Chenopodium quinoa TaxID=63459 RepID=A0A803MPE3_CHEQI
MQQKVSKNSGICSSDERTYTKYTYKTYTLPDASSHKESRSGIKVLYHLHSLVCVESWERINLEEVMEELGLGPNGGLIYCMEELEDNLNNWLTEKIDDFLDDDYLVFGCPGQIKLFSHIPVLKNFVEHLQRKSFNVCVVYFLD